MVTCSLSVMNVHSQIQACRLIVGETQIIITTMLDQVDQISEVINWIFFNFS